MAKRQTIEERNKGFNSATLKEQRVAIAKDAIKQIKAEKFIAEAGTYLGIEEELGCEVGDELQKVLKKRKNKGAVCKVCGIGAAFISTVRLFDNYKIKEEELDGWDYSTTLAVEHMDMRILLSKYFSPSQLSLIECAFEVRWGFGMSDSYKKDREAAAIFGDKYEDDNERLLAIFENIVAHNGIFKP